MTLESFSEKALNDLKTHLRQFSIGCPELCPLCNSKCTSSDPNHEKHECSCHIFPAFHGFRAVANKSPSLFCCTSDICSQKRFETKLQTEYLRRDKFLATYYPSWSGLKNETIDPLYETKLKRAWVKCRKYFCDRFNMNDDLEETHPDWIEAHGDPEPNLKELYEEYLQKTNPEELVKEKRDKRKKMAKSLKIELSEEIDRNLVNMANVKDQLINSIVNPVVYDLTKYGE
ncbi:predicted protein, partial [Naegleria gruberi]